MRKIRHIIAVVCAGVLLVACDDQRDLYVEAGPMLYVEGDWQPSLGKSDMRMDATVMVFNTGNGAFGKEYFYAPNNATVKIEKGAYDVLLFNGLMYTAEDTHLDGIFFRGTERFDTFEAVAQEAVPNKRLGRSDGEYIATNEMEMMTSASAAQTIDGANAYFAKYKDGKNGYDTPDNYVEAELKLVPQAVSYPCKVTLTLSNISGVYSASAAVYGFVGSAYLGSHRPSNFAVTHQFYLNHLQYLSRGNDMGTIESPEFVTFGPPIDRPSQRYTVFYRITLSNGVVVEDEVDVTEQIAPVIAAIERNLSGTASVEHGIEIPIAIGPVELPEVEPVEGVIGVDDWGDDEIIHVPIRP